MIFGVAMSFFFIFSRPNLRLGSILMIFWGGNFGQIRPNLRDLWSAMRFLIFSRPKSLTNPAQSRRSPGLPQLSFVEEFFVDNQSKSTAMNSFFFHVKKTMATKLRSAANLLRFGISLPRFVSTAAPP